MWTKYINDIVPFSVHIQGPHVPDLDHHPIHPTPVDLEVAHHQVQSKTTFIMFFFCLACYEQTARRRYFFYIDGGIGHQHKLM